MAQSRTTAASTLRERVLSPLASSAADSTSWASLAGNAVRASISELRPEFGRLMEQFEHDAAALRGYAAAVESIAQDARSLRVREHDARDALMRLQARERVLEQDPGAVAELQTVEYRVRVAAAGLAALEQEWDHLAQRRRAADDACVAALSSVASRGGYAALPQHGDVEGLSDSELVTMLLGLSGAELLALLGSDPSLANRIAAMDDPDAVARWWRSLAEPVPAGAIPVPSELQQQLLETYPEMLGNLDGIWFGHRDIANRIVFEREWAVIAPIAAEYFALVHTAANSTEYDNAAAAFLAEHGYTESEFVPLHAELKAIYDTLNGAPIGSAAPPYQFIQYEPGQPTLAAISVGNMDTASQITTAVPGMGSSVTRSLEEWTLTAAGLYAQQSAINEWYGIESGLATVAWIGYDAPDMPPSIEVWGSDHAHAGAANLVDFLEGITAVREWAPGENLSVLGHSYGTTTASLALVDTPAENFVMLGSAGIDNSIGHVSDLQVDQANVWASEADGDNIADIGRGYLDEWFFQGPILEDWMGEQALYQHQVDPTSAAYGANVFSSEDAWVDVPGPGQEWMEGSDWHSSTPQLEAQLDGTTTDALGYLDAGTNPLYSSALLTLGLTDPVVEIAPRPGEGDGSGGGPSGGSDGGGASGGGGGGGGGRGR